MALPLLKPEQVVPVVTCEHPARRMATFLSARAFMAESDWLDALGKVWIGCDDITVNRGALERVLPLRRCPEMMTRMEQALLDELPGVVQVFRGVTSLNARGLSWSLDRRCAGMIPHMHRYRGRDPRLLTAEVPREKIVALLLLAGEKEVVTFDARITTSEAIPQSPFPDASIVDQITGLHEQEQRASRNRAAIDALLQGRILPVAEVDVNYVQGLEQLLAAARRQLDSAGMPKRSLADYLLG